MKVLQPEFSDFNRQVYFLLYPSGEICSRLLGNMKKSLKKKLKKTLRTKKIPHFGVFTYGEIDPAKGKLLLLVLAIIFTGTLAAASNIALLRDEEVIQIAGPFVRPQTPMEMKVNKLVAGYPIAEMTPYIFSKDPKVAAFMIAIAKKESAWGRRSPVLAGRDCYNYWGFRLKTDSMGSGGHTCFDTPQEAVDVVASRLDELVNQEKLDSPKEMIVWKCGYGCQDLDKTASEKKWISDVDIYYSKLKGYL